MARTKQTARVSVGGRAPRTQLATKAFRPSFAEKALQIPSELKFSLSVAHASKIPMVFTAVSY